MYGRGLGLGGVSASILLSMRGVWWVGGWRRLRLVGCRVGGLEERGYSRCA